MKRVEADWSDVILVCRKCSKKLKGGFGPDGEQTLAKALRTVIAADKKRGTGKKARRRGESVAVIEVGCLDICPKRAVMALRAGAPGEWLVVPRGCEMEEVAAGLGMAPLERSPSSFAADGGPT